MRALGWLFMVLGWLVTGCAPRLSLGTPCDLDSECEVPLACNAGRCRVACATSRDCPYPLSCVNVGGGLSACRVTEDDACRMEADDCAPPLACVAGRCVEPCDQAESCVIENVCTEGACQPPPVVMLGSCSPLGDSRCGGGEVCARIDDGFECASSPTPLALGAPCTAQAECATGASCVTGRCVRLCVPGSTNCGPGSRCRDGIDLIGHTGAPIGPLPPEGLGYCTEVCDPLADAANDGCPDGTACSIAVPGSAPLHYYCRSLELPSLEVDAFCGDGVDGDLCPPGTQCDDTRDGSRACLAFCDPEAPSACSNPSRPLCEAVSIAGAPVGLCLRER